MASCTKEPIAVIGSGCRFAGNASSPSKLWDVLRAPADLLQEIPNTRFNPHGFYHENSARHGHSNVRHAYVLSEDLACFDADFFGVKPVEAKAVDPQQRLLLEVSYEALEAAGVSISSQRGSDTGVFVGVMFNDYATMLLRDYETLPTYFATGTGQSVLSNRLSHFYDWHGPSVTVDTACSSSLVAIHLAVQALRSGDCRMALACGANLIMGPESFIIESKLNMLSPTGRSRMWDQKADGYARGEGIAAIVLKPLSIALEDGDHIECVIRETGINQDGATPGITVPSASAQEMLMRSTYSRAGLDLNKKSDRPLLFEAHGTGTPVGDPKEAEAIYKTFNTEAFSVPDSSEPLDTRSMIYAGSIKTVLGHTEGAAGIAALLKASLAIQKRQIPPNLLFDELSDNVAPFYKNIKILRKPIPWPAAHTRRASVNSFGFGGTNAHAIVESYDEAISAGTSSARFVNGDEPHFTLFVFSAHSGSSLRAMLSDYADYLNDESLGIHPWDLAWTLRQRRSVLSHRISFAACSLPDLKAKIQTVCGENQDVERSDIGTKALSAQKGHHGSRPKILGIFTGQGAQHARMGASLLEKSVIAQEIVQQLQSFVDAIQEQESPGVSWSLRDELLAESSFSRVHEAELSQPLCTALQILLVDLLRLSGVQFSVVLGHSSGEIGAAYAAGHISARDAMCIAYLRGLHASLASSPNGTKKGAMLAVGASMEDMEELCSDERFEGRISVAASNSSSSVTLAGDEDAISEMEDVLGDEHKFYRRLKVDKAYHSRHMGPCFDPYITSLARLDINPTTSPPRSCPWFSSVDGDLYKNSSDSRERLKGLYWAENFTQRVLYSQAVTAALKSDPCDLILEVGPHPALQAPTQLNTYEALGKELPYHSTLSRNSDAVESFSDAVGFLWSNLDEGYVKLNELSRIVTNLNDQQQHFRIVNDLPTYTWDHSTRYWHESRTSRKTRLRGHPVHFLLGHSTPDSSPHHLRWRNLLHVEEMEWLAGHAVQGQVVLPAAAYVATALEASQLLSPSDDIRLIELMEFAIHRALPFDQGDAGIEIVAELTDVVTDQSTAGDKTIRARFTYEAALDVQTDNLSLVASARVVVHLGEPSEFLLPPRGPPLPHAIEVESDRFYSALDDLGYNFAGRFRALSSMRRNRGRASCLVKMPPHESREPSVLIHPAELDAMLQTVLLAYSYPYDEELRALHLPTTIHRICVSPAALRRASLEDFLPVDTVIHFGNTGAKTAENILADVHCYPTRHTLNPAAAIQVHAIAFQPLGGPAGPDQDRPLYSKECWVPAMPDSVDAARQLWEDDAVHCKARLLERIAVYYLRRFHRQVPADHAARATFPTNWYLNFARHVSSMVESQKHMWWQPEWDRDTVESLQSASKPHMHLPDFQIMHLVGAQMPRVFEGYTTMLEEFRNADDILDRYYASGTITNKLAQWLASAVKQIALKNPRMNILEVGAGTGGATKAILSEIGDGFSTYTYTDISAGFFETASHVFSPWKPKMTFRVLDVGRDPSAQGFTERSYDLVVAFFVIHATSDLRNSLSNLRKLLKPGGFLAMGEGADNGTGTATSGFIFGTLPGWWAGADKGRQISPLISAQEWDGLLRSSGFSGLDASPVFSADDVFSVLPVVSQAVDHHVNLLREPICFASAWSNHNVPPIMKLIFVGGRSPLVAKILNDIIKALVSCQLVIESHRFESLADIDADVMNGAECVLVSLTDLDSPVFENIDEPSFQALKSIFLAPKSVLWITSGRLDDEPYANMTAAFARCAANEEPGINLQLIDVADPWNTNPRVLAEAIPRFHAALSLGYDSTLNEDVFWTIEREILIDPQGRQYVPRLRFVDELNDRYNSGRRPIIRDLKIHESQSPVRLQIEHRKTCNHHILREVTRYEIELWRHANSSEDWTELQIAHSTISAIKTSAGYRFLVRGIEPKTKEFYLALVPSLCSVTMVLRSDMMRWPSLAGTSDQDFFHNVATHVAAQAVLREMLSGQILLAHNVPLAIAEALAIQAMVRKLRVIFTTDSSDASTPKSWIRLPIYSGQCQLDAVLPDGEPPDVFLGLSGSHNEGFNETTIISRLKRQGTTILTASSIFSDTAASRPNVRPSHAISEALSAAVSFAINYSSQGGKVVEQDPSLPNSAPVSELSLGEVVKQCQSYSSYTCPVNWQKTPGALPVRVSRLDHNRMFRGSDATYWIVGMSGALGISLTDWMISKGARNLVITSRNPAFEAEWIAAHRRRGAIITVVRCDVADEVALRDAHRKICCMLPPIRGVIHGAMTLRDVSVRNMSLDQLRDVTRPKVDGSINLDKIFHSIDLDFFVLTSSINNVIANRGQANYAAANSFMCSLAAQRRKRGLRAAAVNGGAIIGAGYMERDSRLTWDRVAQNNWMMRLSEDDFVQSVCEGIEASRLDGHGPDISTGLNYVPKGVDNAPFWASDPKFAVFMVPHEPVSLHETNEPEAIHRTTASIQNALKHCQSREAVLEVVQSAFSQMLRTTLQNQMPDKDLLASRGDEIGLDSLMSVTIRSWFLKQMQVGIPVLKIMSSETVQDLVEFAVNTMPSVLVPDVTVLSAAPAVGEDDNGRPQLPEYGPHASSDLSSANEAKSSPSDVVEGVVDRLEVVSTAVSSHRSDLTRSSLVNKHDIDWVSESQLPSSLMNIPMEQNVATPAAPPRSIVLTGGSGLLGRHLLIHLLARSSTLKVFCIATRDLARRLISGELISDDARVEYYQGDLAVPLLGLTPTQATSIFSTADAVIHNGADTSHIKSYRDIRSSNVGSTLEIMRLCIPRRVPLHFVSSAGLAILYGKEAFPPVAVTGPECAQPAKDGSFGYASAKWTCEALLEKAHAHYKGAWPVCIHRPSTILREGADKVGYKASLDWLNMMIHYSQKLKCVPEIRRNRGSIDLVSVKTACESVVTLIMEPDENMRRGAVGYAHQVGDRVIPFDQLNSIGLEETEHRPFMTLPMREWVSRALAAGLHPAVAALVELIDDPDQRDYPKLLKVVPRT